MKLLMCQIIHEHYCNHLCNNKLVISSGTSAELNVESSGSTETCSEWEAMLIG